MKKGYIVAVAIILTLALTACSNTSWLHFTDEEPDYDYNEYEERGGEPPDQEAEWEAHEAEYAHNEMYEEHPNGMDWTDVEDHVGEYVYFFGKVMDVDSESAGGDPTFVDVGGIYPDNRVTGVIWPEYSSAFSNIHDIEGEYICMNGTVYMYDGTPNIELTSPSQIEVLGY